MEFGCTNSEGKIQEVDLETVIIYGRGKHSEKCHHSGFQLHKKTVRFFLPRYYSRQSSRLWLRLLHKTELITLEPGKLIYYLALKNEKPENLYAKHIWEEITVTKWKNNERALNEHFWKNAADQIVLRLQEVGYQSKALTLNKCSLLHTKAT